MPEVKNLITDGSFTPDMYMWSELSAFSKKLPTPDEYNVVKEYFSKKWTTVPDQHYFDGFLMFEALNDYFCSVTVTFNNNGGRHITYGNDVTCEGNETETICKCYIFPGERCWIGMSGYTQHRWSVTYMDY